MSNIFRLSSLLTDNPMIWELSRLFLDKAFGLYSKRIQLIRNKSFYKNSLSVLDIGCGTGQYSTITQGQYLGLDINNRYIKYAGKRHRNHNQSFKCADVTVITKELPKFDMVLMTDFLHHIPSQQCINLLNVCTNLVNQYVINFEPVTEQYNPIGRWVNKNDRGKYIRSLDELHQIYKESQLELIESLPLMIGPISTCAIISRPTILDKTKLI
jgi:2-polyprenyl-3-methyl-5-hydroxy-6-metoxy-1,4-benzoquinol methylase